MERLRKRLGRSSRAWACSWLCHPTRLSGGYIEMHFHYFVVVAVVTLYQSWILFLIAIAFVVFEHAVIGMIDPTAR